MKPKIPCIALLSLLAVASPSRSQNLNGEPAIDLLGQYDQTSFIDPVPIYTKSGPNDGPNKFGFATPTAVAVDPVRHRLFVSEANNGRVLVFDLDAANLLLDRVPDKVLGKPDFVTGVDFSDPTPSAASLDGPEGIAYDADGDRLFVADRFDTRVVVFDTATITNGEPAVNVLGQPDFATMDGGFSETQMESPRALAYDPSGKRLFVSDRGNNRVTVYDVAAITDGEAAIGVLGQPGFAEPLADTSQSGMDGPRGLVYDDAGKRLFVSDSGNNRVLVFDAAEITNGENALNVLGQPDFVSSGSSDAQDGMSSPDALGFDPARNRLFVAQKAALSGRLHIYDVASISDGEPAVNVLGAPDFASELEPQSPAALGFFDAQYAIAFDPGTDRLYVPQASFNRVSIFDASSISDGEEAVDLLGQYGDTAFPSALNPRFDKFFPNNGPNRFGLYGSVDVALDAAHHRLFVLENLNGRVLVYNLNADNLLIDHVPDNVLGQPDFATSDLFSSAARANNLLQPFSIEYDPVRDRLFVADTGHARVVVYDVASIENGEDAIAVLGQEDLESGGFSFFPTGSNFASVTGLAYDPAEDRLFVGDSAFERVMVFDVASIANGEPAVNVLGQLDFVSIRDPFEPAAIGAADLAYDGASKRLYVADVNKSRVVVYDLTSIQDGEDPVNVLGQPDLETFDGLTSQAGMQFPFGVEIDSAGKRLFVSDAGNRRVLIFDVAAINDGQNASFVLGKADFSASEAPLSRSSLEFPLGLEFDALSSRLLVSDFADARVMFFPLAFTLSYSGSRFVESSANDGSIGTTLTVTLKNDNFEVANGEMTPGLHYTAANVPDGLSLLVSGTSATTATVRLVGRASAHESANQISNIGLTFLNAAFTFRAASDISGSSKSDFALDFDSAVFQDPAVQPGDLSGRILKNGRPVEGALVYVPGLGVATTDRNGIFVLSGAVPGQTYQFSLQKSGVDFSGQPSQVGSGQFLTVNGADRLFNPRLCQEAELSGILSDLAAAAVELRRLAVDTYSRLGRRTGRPSQAGFQRQVLEQLDDYLNVSRSVPEVALSCAPAIGGCAAQDLTGAKAGLLGALGNLRRDALFANRKLRPARRGKSSRKAKRFRNMVEEMSRGTEAKVESLPDSSSVCS